MGVEYRGMLCVGYTYEQTVELWEDCEEDKYEDFYEFCEAKGLENLSPYYDADKEHCIFGTSVVSSDDYCYEEVNNLDQAITTATEELKKQFSKEPKAYIMAHGW